MVGVTSRRTKNATLAAPQLHIELRPIAAKKPKTAAGTNRRTEDCEDCEEKELKDIEFSALPSTSSASIKPTHAHPTSVEKSAFVEQPEKQRESQEFCREGLERKEPD